MTIQTKKLELCIPRISINISKDTIFKTFCSLKLGYIERISEIPLKSNPLFKRIIIRIKSNPSTNQAKCIHQRILNSEPVFIVYDMPWYWKIVLNQVPTGIIPPPAYVPLSLSPLS